MQDLEYEVVRSDRASRPRIDVNLHRTRVVVPSGMNLDPEDLVRRKEDWLRSKLEEMRELRERVPERRFEVGASFPFRGTDHTVQLGPHEESRVVHGFFELAEERVSKTGIKDELESLYRRKAKIFIEETLERYAPELGVEYGTVRVKNQKTLWGSCSSKKNLNYNWRLTMAPRPIGRYVVLHELCHLVHANHDEPFWNLLSEYCEKPREKARWLREHSVELIFTEDDL